MQIRGIRSPIQKKDMSIIDMARGFHQVNEVHGALKDLLDGFTSKLNDAHTLSKEELGKVITEFRASADRELQKILKQSVDFHAGQFRKIFADLQSKANAVIQAVDHAKTIQKGDPGAPGKDAVPPPPIDPEEIAGRVLKRIRQPKDGQDAVVTEEMISNALMKLAKDKKLKPEHIDGYENAMSVLRNFVARGSVRGGGDTVAAGSNITITTVNGVKTINAPGGAGGSGYQAPLSGGLTGTNTWTSAPSVIVVDGVPRQKTSTDGTVNWTGTTTTVLTITPVFDVYASA